jgi:hypothetical protein
VIAAAAIALCVLIFYGLVLVLFHFEEPVVRARLIGRLESRLHAKAELDSVHLSLGRGVVLSGSGLRIVDIGGGQAAAAPSLTVRGFQLHGGLISMLLERQDSTVAYVQGMVVTLPAALAKGVPAGKLSQGHTLASRDVLMLDRVVVTDARVLVQAAASGNPLSNPPIELDFGTLIVGDFAAGKPFAYDAVLEGLNHHAKLRSTGHVGPWTVDAPAELPVDGNYDLSALDLSVVRGLSGTLSARGRVAGGLKQLEIDGTSETPNLALSTSARPQAYDTKYHAVLDGLTGNLRIDAATMRLNHTTMHATGTIARSGSGSGFVTKLDLTSSSGRVEDQMTLLSSPKPAVIEGAEELRSHMTILPGTAPLIERITVTGSARLTGVTSTDLASQQKMDSIGMRADGHAREASKLSPNLPIVPITMTGNFRIAGGNMDLSNVICTEPGALMLLEGRYELTGTQVEMHGVLRTLATASHMTTGIMSLLAKPLDPLLRKHGAGMEIPIELKGDRVSPHFGLDLTHRGRDEEQTEGVAARPKP